MKPDELKQLLEAQLEKIQTAMSTSSVVDVKKNLEIAIAKAKTEINEHISTFEAANAKADGIIDPLLEKAQKSRFTPLLVAFLILSAMAAGVAIGIHL
ncbi:hypothetical protein [Nitrosomonas oligotropha]|uniref:hypothetical protein n=1 Tax=Nitrosomonas oligotropha TaxID=42354 RepID=UPI00136D17B4|nr:hypothetical protein [Nitrosomonas oligotropha]MXS81584.1 hypothetical protein [Nitrosomonas oligotropha]